MVTEDGTAGMSTPAPVAIWSRVVLLLLCFHRGDSLVQNMTNIRAAISLYTYSAYIIEYAPVHRGGWYFPPCLRSSQTSGKRVGTANHNLYRNVTSFININRMEIEERKTERRQNGLHWGVIACLGRAPDTPIIITLWLWTIQFVISLQSKPGIDSGDAIWTW